MGNLFVTLLEDKTAMHFAPIAHNLTSEFRPPERPKNTAQKAFDSCSQGRSNDRNSKKIVLSRSMPTAGCL